MKLTHYSLKAVGVGLLLTFATLNGCKTDISPEPVESKQKSASNITTFRHPGVVNSRASLTYIRDQVNSGNQYRSDWYQVLTSYIDGKIYPSGEFRDERLKTPIPQYVDVAASAATEDEEKMKLEAHVAYICALRWAKSGDPVYADVAKKILNRWAVTFIDFKILSGSNTKQRQMSLEAAWVAPVFAAAAEIIKHYRIVNENGTHNAGWSIQDSDRFETFLLKLNSRLSYIFTHDDVEDGNDTDTHTDEGEGFFNTNWGASAGFARMAIGVFVDNPTMYTDGLNFVKRKIPQLTTSDGTIHELCERDCYHPQYTLTALTYAAETERIQGSTTIYSANSNRLRTSYIWTRDRFVSGGGCRSCTTYKNIYPGVEVANNYYYHSTYNTSPIDALRDRNDDGTIGQTSDFTFFGFTTYTHRNVTLALD